MLNEVNMEGCRQNGKKNWGDEGKGKLLDMIEEMERSIIYEILDNEWKKDEREKKRKIMIG